MKFIKLNEDHSRLADRDYPVMNSLDVYRSDSFLLREFFWLRLRILTYLISKISNNRKLILDFGGGGGVMLPTLAKYFQKVHLIDISIQDAQSVVEFYKLSNVNLIESNILKTNMEDGCYSNILAADVLEHFEDIDLPIQKIKSWLSSGGVLYTSLPTENFFYRLLRTVFKKQKPHDHYHTADVVERALKRNGFIKKAALYHPLILPILPLFRISAWQKI